MIFEWPQRIWGPSPKGWVSREVTDVDRAYRRQVEAQWRERQQEQQQQETAA